MLVWLVYVNNSDVRCQQYAITKEDIEFEFELNLAPDSFIVYGFVVIPM